MTSRTQEKINKLTKKIQETEALLDEWEKKQMLAENPSEKKRCEVEINELKAIIGGYEG